MKLVVQRVSRASVEADSETVGSIHEGLLVLVGVADGDDFSDVSFCARKILQLRIFEDDEGRMNRSVQEIGGAILLVSQFTLLGKTRRGNRPSFSGAAGPAEASRLFEELVHRVSATGLRVETGRFQAMMDVELVNRGPVTLLVDSKE